MFELNKNQKKDKKNLPKRIYNVIKIFKFNNIF